MVQSAARGNDDDRGVGVSRDLGDRLLDKSARIAIIGQGYVGLPLAMHASDAGYSVVGFDIDDDKVAALLEGRSYVEDVTDDALAAALAKGYLPTTDPAALRDIDVVVVSVPTGLSDGAPDLSNIEAASELVAASIQPGALVILESTTYPGTTEELVGGTIERASAGALVAGRDYYLGYSPERIDPGNPTYDLRNTPKVVSGIDAASLELVTSFYGTFVEKVIPVSSTAVAELVKLMENTFRHVNIALVNELAIFAADLGIDVWEALDAAATKPFGYMRFTPGPGVGGHCLPIDPTYLSWRVRRRLGETFRFVELANDVNEHMPAYVVRRVQAMLNRDQIALNGSHIVVLGLAYKPGTSDAREAPSVSIIDRLERQGARITAVDPHVSPLLFSEPTMQLRALTPHLIEEADVVLLITDHDDFDYELIGRHAQRIFDTRHRVRPPVAGRLEYL